MDKKQALEQLGKYGLGDYQYKVARAELDIQLAAEQAELAQGLVATIQAARENMYEALANLASQVVGLKDQLRLATTSADRSSAQMAFLTKVLIGTNIAYVILTAGILYVTWAR